jgi:Asp-tRNA(Asn)/Glu-tRNA(Gln) amidotransferase C subunit
MAQVLHDALYDAPEDVAMRPDAARPGFSQGKALSNAPESGSGHFKVSKVIER